MTAHPIHMCRGMGNCQVEASVPVVDLKEDVAGCSQNQQVSMCTSPLLMGDQSRLHLSGRAPCRPRLTWKTACCLTLQRSQDDRWAAAACLTEAPRRSGIAAGSHAHRLGHYASRHSAEHSAAQQPGRSPPGGALCKPRALLASSGHNVGHPRPSGQCLCCPPSQASVTVLSSLRWMHPTARGAGGSFPLRAPSCRMQHSPLRTGQTQQCWCSRSSLHCRPCMHPT